MPELGAHPTLADFQKYAAELEDERGFSEQDVVQKCLMLGEEVGELFKVVRKHTKIKVDPNSSIGEAGEELTDIFIFLLAIANRLNVDLEQAFRDKEEKNKTRVWQ